MKRLQGVVNIVPLIAKADTFTPEELVHFKQRVGSFQSPGFYGLSSQSLLMTHAKCEQIRADLEHHEIKTYPLANNGQATHPSVPFAVVGHNYENSEDGQRVRYRKTRFGLIDGKRVGVQI
jgi:septin 3/9/12